MWCSSNEETVSMKSKFIEIMSNEFEIEDLSTIPPISDDTDTPEQPTQREACSSVTYHYQVQVYHHLLRNQKLIHIYRLPEDTKPLDIGS